MGAPVIRSTRGSIRSTWPAGAPWMVRSTCATFPAAALGQAPPPMTGPEGLKAREGMIRGMFTPQTPGHCRSRSSR
jgi:hypothetical protein